MESLKQNLWLLWALYRLMYWRVWGRKPRHLGKNYGLKNDSKFISARDAAMLIPDDAVVLIGSLGAIKIATGIFCAICERFKSEGSPRGITILAPAGQGGRGMVPWTIDHLFLFGGLVARFFTGHIETFKNAREAADRGKIEMHCIHQGAFVQLIGQLAKGSHEFFTKAGLGTKFGQKSSVTPNAKDEWVQTVDDKVRVTCPLPNVAILCVGAVDRWGNAYGKYLAARCELLEAAQAVKKNGGIVIVQAGSICGCHESEVLIPEKFVDYVVVRPDTPQILCFTQCRPFRALTLGAKFNPVLAGRTIRLINKVAHLTPARDEDDFVIARAAAMVAAKNLKRGGLINFGIGMPELVGAAMMNAGLGGQFSPMLETGVCDYEFPASGWGFGAAVNPARMISSVEAFQQIEAGIGVAVLGAVNVRIKTGDVNLSAKGPGILGQVGPGGAITIAESADVVVFILRSRKGFVPRFLDDEGHMEEVTISGAQLLKRGKKVFYVTDFGVMELTDSGLELTSYLPGYYVNSVPDDIRINNDVHRLPYSVKTGQGFTLELVP